MSRLAVILELLADGAWHDVAELRRLLGLDACAVEEVVSFLCEYAFVQFDKTRGLVRVNPDFKKLFVEFAH